MRILANAGTTGVMALLLLGAASAAKAQDAAPGQPAMAMPAATATPDPAVAPAPIAAAPASDAPAPAAMPDMPMAGHAEAGNGKTHAASHDDLTVPAHPMLLTGYGNGGFTVTTAVPEAQAFFSNGMELAMAFAHPAAVAAMTEAVRLDPHCAMCEWGLAYADGPTLNYDKTDEERAALYRHALRARTLAAKTGTPLEKALIASLVTRYHPGKPEKREPLYTAALRRIAEAHPDNDAVAVLTADSIMQTAFLTRDEPALKGAVAMLEPVLARNPTYTPAIHFYIHAAEVTGAPAKAEKYADTLEGLAPRASHLVHMPSHIYYWVGRYQDAADANRRAVRIGIEQARAVGAKDPAYVWGLPYHAHNVIFGLGGAMMAGDARTALELGRPLVERAQASEKAPPVLQLLSAAGYFAVARFDPASVAALPEPKLPYLKAAWHYARGEAADWQGDLDAMKAELAAIPDHIAEPEAAKKGRRKASDADKPPAAPEQMLAITRGVLEGRVAMREGRPADAAAIFARAADVEETEDFSQFSDPPAFWYPVRRDAGAALLAAGDRDGATRALEASLKLRPNDPVALALLEKAKTAPNAVAKAAGADAGGAQSAAR